MGNIIPGPDGYITPDQFANVVGELRDVLEPIMDRNLSIEDGMKMAFEALEAVAVLRGIDREYRAKIIAFALSQIAAEVLADMAVIYDDEL